MSDLKNTVKETASKLIASLNQRNRDIIARRFGLKTGSKETLESIGQSYRITRERVRQIEEVSLAQIRKELATGGLAKVKPLVALAENVLEQAGGVLNEQEFFNRFFGAAAAAAANNNKIAGTSLVFILTLDGGLKRLPEDDNFYFFWSLSEQHAQAFRDSVAAFVGAFAKNGSPVVESALADFSKKFGVSSKYTTPSTLTALTSVSKKIGKNIFGQVGLTSWPDIKPRGVKDKSYLVLRETAKPQHFREIAKLINETFGPRVAVGQSTAQRKGNIGTGTANVQTVHNELIKDGRFVLVGRGMYGLAEWGYKAGTVKDVLVELLRSANKPLKRDELVTQVLSHRMVKENTILLNLQNSKVFKKTDQGYTLTVKTT